MNCLVFLSRLCGININELFYLELFYISNDNKLMCCCVENFAETKNFFYTENSSRFELLDNCRSKKCSINLSIMVQTIATIIN